jgi:hypothetical protein
MRCVSTFEATQRAFDVVGAGVGGDAITKVELLAHSGAIQVEAHRRAV